MPKNRFYRRALLFILLVTELFLFAACANLYTPVKEKEPERRLQSVPSFPPNFEQLYYEKFNRLQTTRRWRLEEGTSAIRDIDSLPKDPYGMINWTASVIQGFIHPLGAVDLDAVEDEPLMLNIFIEAKVPLMFNVLFPHSIHTYWLSCENCHPSIFIAKAGANPITMEEIFKGKWCGRCHNKVAFPFWPKSNCNRCHIVDKGMSLQIEKF